MITGKILAAFKRVGERNTRPRPLIADRLAELADHGVDFSIDDLWQALRQQAPHLGRATLYRCIRPLSDPLSAAILER